MYDIMIIKKVYKKAVEKTVVKSYFCSLYNQLVFNEPIQSLDLSEDHFAIFVELARKENLVFLQILCLEIF